MARMKGGEGGWCGEVGLWVGLKKHRIMGISQTIGDGTYCHND